MRTVSNQIFQLLRCLDHSEQHPHFLTKLFLYTKRMRRGALCTALSERGITKLALGHHFDDAVETFLLSLVYEGRISCFQPVTHMTRTGVDQIRPMLYAGDGRIANLAKALALPIVENPCPEDRGSKRYEIKQFIRTMSQTYPDLRSKVFGAIQRAPLDGWEKAR